MEKDPYFEILNLLSKKGINTKCTITPLVNELFDSTTFDDLSLKKDVINYFMMGMHNNRHLIYYSIIVTNDLFSEDIHDDNYQVIASITVDGFNFLNNEKNRLLNERLTSSTLNTNNAIGKNSKKQTIILFVAAFLSLLSLLVSWLNYCATNDKSAQKLYLLPSKELIESIKQKSSIQRIEKSDVKPEKKTLPKNS